MGVTLNNDGTLAFDDSKLKAKYAADPQAVEQFFATADLGLSDRFEKLLAQLSGDSVSLIASRLDTLQTKIAENQKRIEFMNERLEAEQNRLLMDFYRMEIAVGKMQSYLSTIESIQPLPSLISVRRWSQQ